MAEEKTNVMRILDQKKVAYTPHHYAHPDGAVDGVSVAALIDRDPSCVCKTLVTQGASKKYYVFVIPVGRELDLKAAARVSGNKKADLIPMKELLPVTGYIRGGCSPVGMNKAFPTWFHATAADYPFIYVSAGVRGLQLKVAPSELIAYVHGSLADISRKA